MTTAAGLGVSMFLDLLSRYCDLRRPMVLPGLIPFRLTRVPAVRGDRRVCRLREACGIYMSSRAR